MLGLISDIIYLEVVAFLNMLLGVLYLLLHSKYPNTYVGYASKNAKKSNASWETANRTYGITAIVNSLAIGVLVICLSGMELLSGAVSALILTELIFLPIIMAEFLAGRAHKKYELSRG